MKSESFEIIQIPREDNVHADALASMGSTSKVKSQKVMPFECLERESIEEIEEKINGTNEVNKMFLSM